MPIVEYTPRGGWYNYNRRRQLRRSRLKATAAYLAACCIYASISTIIYYM